MEFIRRLLQHVLPKGFVKIRHYGLSASANLHTKHATAMACLGPLPELASEPEGDQDLTSEPSDGVIATGVLVILLAAAQQVPCPRCHTGRLRIRGHGPEPPR